MNGNWEEIELPIMNFEGVAYNLTFLSSFHTGSVRADNYDWSKSKRNIPPKRRKWQTCKLLCRRRRMISQKNWRNDQTAMHVYAHYGENNYFNLLFSSIVVCIVARSFWAVVMCCSVMALSIYYVKHIELWNMCYIRDQLFLVDNSCISLYFVFHFTGSS